MSVKIETEDGPQLSFHGRRGDETQEKRGENKKTKVGNPFMEPVVYSPVFSRYARPQWS